jgi:PAS domain S-box-containing protein
MSDPLDSSEANALDPNDLSDDEPEQHGDGDSAETRVSGIIPRTRLDSWRVPEPSGEAVAVELAPMTPSDVAMVSTELSRLLGEARSELALATAFVHSVARALPKRMVVLRLESPEGPAIASNLRETPAVVPLQISRAGAELFVLEDRIDVRETHTLVAPGADHGFDLPILTESRLRGVLAIEYPAGVRAPAGELAPVLALVALLRLSLEALRARRERDSGRAQVASVVTHTTVPAFLIDARGRVLAASEGAADLVRRKMQDVLGKPADMIATPGAKDAVREGLGRAMRGEVVERMDMRTVRSNGIARVIWTAAPAMDADGVTHTTLCVGEDLTDVTRLEGQIVHTEKLATLGQLAAGVVHELNNPLTSISVYTDYLLQKGRRTGGDPADLDRLGRIAEAAARMLRFTRDLVTYARPSTEEPSAVALPEVLAQSAGFCEHVLREANVTLTLRTTASLPKVRGLKGQLQQVFVNLFTNAAHAIAEHRESDATGNIVVSTSLDADHAMVEVADDGPGIRAEHLSKVFEPFFSTKTEGKGTGLGLSIVRNIVRLHGGTIEIRSVHIESKPTSTGTRFLIRLPLFVE